MAKNSDAGITAVGDLFGNNNPTPTPEPIPDPTPGTRKRPAKKERPKVEIKSKRVQLVMKPSLYAKLKKQTDAMGMSVNDYVNQLIELDLAEG